MDKVAYWDFHTCDMGAYIQCSHCGRKIGVKKFVMADQDWFSCPECQAKMKLDRLDYDKIVQEASNEC